ncbi:glutaminase A [Sphingobacterium yanglingense]|uniref:Glutaminase n=1 Tax=Sphingobacterium yanglingense TaxID=1437280 RepID=A0A4R6WIM2_9SPHI|nr:glutaminase A [Sphingobacterium yanglingense]TDQ80083.1 L-glutaminase [Sphingobacterium yanglingense]
MNRDQTLHRLKNVLTIILIILVTGSISFAQKSNTTAIDVASLSVILEKNKHYYKEGVVADYIPELGKVNPAAIAFAIVDSNGKLISVGDRDHKFTMQSVSKIIALMLAVMENGEKSVFEKIGYYGTDRPFNHFANLETMGKPLNPMMNAGAILTTSMISGQEDKPFIKILEMIRYITNNPSITYSQAVYQSEKETGHRNRGMFYLIKNTGAITGSEDQLNNYFRQCSIELTTEDLAKIGYFFANECRRYDGDNRYENKSLAKLILSQMLIAGMYEFSGEYARTVGLPSKSGVGGGIVVSVPHCMGIGVFSPALDNHGNSLAGYHMILDLANEYGLSIF